MLRLMRTITLERINENILKHSKSADAAIRTSSTSKRKKKSRTRAPGEVQALNEISVARWQKAVRAGKISRLGDRKLYYDYSE